MNLVQVEKSVIAKHKRQLLEVFTPLLRDKKVVFFDVPVHGNIGDSLIFLGTLQLFKELNVELIDCVSAYEPSRLIQAEYSEDTVFVFQGGGNFGDIYQIHQQMRLSAIKNFTKNRIVIFPQSMHYEDPKQLIIDVTLMAQHKDLHVCVRDTFSYQELKKNAISNTYLTPDIASVLIDILPRPDLNEDKRLLFMRKDVEATKTGANEGVDWIDITPTYKKMLLSVVRTIVKKNNRLKLPKMTKVLVTFIHKSLVRTALNHFSHFSVIKTDRLHGMILSQLMGIKTEALDNTYGKLARYTNTWFENKADKQ